MEAILNVEERQDAVRFSVALLLGQMWRAGSLTRPVGIQTIVSTCHELKC